ncbi:uncharacterized protein BO95DRAFT_513951 [Aspergillus brunneoviolaceus CBS 621.78]|uniref:Uncharacterized protein n=1 Tax=Aspergillus brunneoviolaceus CBS 621.78 TaxID=1450534 RepID=A0ACD1GAN8_9EURO|nr:hypothetical protein BO95DRAFT_513951 [Aspergillus brunneoviolaceus CBS 621.78]RAH46346.1 hypothetical protein BO95DRAFT_513951 [Aspergillus brunneoviolaceus CBS 621.78]
MILKTLLVLLLAGLIAAQATVTDMFIGIMEPQTEGLVASVVGENADETTYLVTCVTPQQTNPATSGCSLAADVTVIAEPSTTQVFSTATRDDFIGYESIICAFDNSPLVTCTQTTHIQGSPMHAHHETWSAIDQAAGYALVTQNLTRFPVTITATAGDAVTATATATATTDEVFTLFSSSVPTATVTVPHAAGPSGSSAKNHTSGGGMTTGTAGGTGTGSANGTGHATSTNAVTSSKSQGAGPLITGEAMVVAGVAAVALAAAVVL